MAATNWARNVTFQARAFHTPSSVDRVQELVGASDRVRALGSGHSFNRIADTTGDLVSLAELPRVLEIDAAAAQVTVSPAVRYGELAPRLHESGLALRNLGSLPHICVAGACATGTHGSGNANGNLATEVAAVEMITSTGEIRRFGRDSDPARFGGAVIALGCLGIVTRLTLDLVPTYDVAQYVYDDLPDDQLDQHLDEILSGAYSVSVFTDLRAHQVWRKCRTDEPVPDRHWFGARLARGPRHPLPGMPAVHCTEQLGVPGPWHQRLPHFRPEFRPSSGAELQSEYLLPRRHATTALAALRELRTQIEPVLQIAEIRTVAADELWLSPSYHRDTTAFHFTWVADEDAVAPVLAAIEERFAALEPRPHWGKLFGLDSAAVSRQYERLADFRSLVRECDPANKFGNELTDRYLA